MSSFEIWNFVSILGLKERRKLNGSSMKNLHRARFAELIHKRRWFIIDEQIANLNGFGQLYCKNSILLNNQKLDPSFLNQLNSKLYKSQLWKSQLNLIGLLPRLSWSVIQSNEVKFVEPSIFTRCFFVCVQHRLYYQPLWWLCSM